MLMLLLLPELLVELLLYLRLVVLLVLYLRRHVTEGTEFGVAGLLTLVLNPPGPPRPRVTAALELPISLLQLKDSAGRGETTAQFFFPAWPSPLSPSRERKPCPCALSMAPQKTQGVLP